MDAKDLRIAELVTMRRDFKIEKPSDEFGQYDLILKCGACGHERRVVPKSLANVCGWDAKLQDVTRRLRCSKAASAASAGARLGPCRESRRGGYKSH